MNKLASYILLINNTHCPHRYATKASSVECNSAQYNVSYMAVKMTDQHATRLVIGT